MGACGPTQTPSDHHAVEYVAVVDEPGAGAPEVETFTATSESDKDNKVEELSKHGEVVAVDENEPVSAQIDGTDDPRFASGEQYGPFSAGFAGVWTSDNVLLGSGITIAVIDTGVNAAHEDLAGQVLQGADFVTGTVDDDYAGDSSYANVDFHGHGTHVAGIAAAADNTVGGLGGAPGASILPVRILDEGGSGSTDNLVSGIMWAADHGADVINMSLGGPSCASTEQAAVEYAESQGVVIVAAAGNSNSSTPIYPAGFGESVMAVGATTQSNKKASFSNWGAPYVDIGAPGNAILSTTSDGAYGLKSGTSMSTPFAAAAVALVLQQCPGISNGDPNGSSRHDKVQNLLKSTATPMIDPLGARLLRVDRAVTTACPA
jgi:thermitase